MNFRALTFLLLGCAGAVRLAHGNDSTLSCRMALMGAMFNRADYRTTTRLLVNEPSFAAEGPRRGRVQTGVPTDVVGHPWGVEFPTFYRDRGFDPTKAGEVEKAFWELASHGELEQVFTHHGMVHKVATEYVPELVTTVGIAPVSVFETKYDPQSYYLLQSGNVLRVDKAEQPLLAHGLVRLYRGTGNMWVTEPPRLNMHRPENVRGLLLYLQFRTFIFANSVAAYAYVYKGTAMASTGHIRTDDLALYTYYFQQTKLPSADATLLMETIHKIQEGNRYTLSHYVAAQRKFGPRYLDLVTEVDNIDFTSGFDREMEAHILNPQRVVRYNLTYPIGENHRQAAADIRAASLRK